MNLGLDTACHHGFRQYLQPNAEIRITSFKQLPLLSKSFTSLNTPQGGSTDSEASGLLIAKLRFSRYAVTCPGFRDK
jgi:hypothetical protein